jgi:hypothetical protein
MSGLRFITARDLFAAFPTAYCEITAKPTDQESRAFVTALVADGAWRDAVGFCAYLLPRREAVFWACRCVRRLAKQDGALAGEPILRTAEAWCVEPGERLRRAALDAARSGHREWAATWAAFAAAWSSGTWRRGGGPIACAPSQTAQGVRAAVLVSLCAVRAAERGREMTQLIGEAVRLAEGNSAVVYEIPAMRAPVANTAADLRQSRTRAP